MTHESNSPNSDSVYIYGVTTTRIVEDLGKIWQQATSEEDQDSKEDVALYMVES